jgi:regulatory protein
MSTVATPSSGFRRSPLRPWICTGCLALGVPFDAECTVPEPRALRAAALRMLARRDHSRAELAQRLARGGGDESEIASVLDALERDGYLSDARCAHALVVHKAGRYGRRAIAHALRERGIDADAARSALEALRGNDEMAEARALVARRFAGAPRDGRERARRIRFLIARGYDAAVARVAVSETRPSDSGVD